MGTEKTGYLDPGRVRFFKRGATLCMTVEGEFSLLKAGVLHAFPVSHQGRYVSVRDGKNSEVGMIADVEELDEQNRRIVKEELARFYLRPVIRRILNVRERFGTLDWTVETDRGQRTFTTGSLHENALQIAPRRVILTDVDSNCYDVPDLNALDQPSRRLLVQHL